MSSLCQILWHNTHVSVSRLCLAQRPEFVPIIFNSGLITALGFFCHFVQSELYNFVSTFTSNIENKDCFLGFTSLQLPLCYNAALLPFL